MWKAAAAGLFWVLLGGTAAAHEQDGGGGRAELSLGSSAEFDYDPPLPGSYRLPVLKAAADGAVLGADGRALRLAELMAGHITVLAFIYTRCSDPNGCPLSMGLLYDLADAGERDPLIGRNLRLIAMSFDPEHDTPAVMAEYGAVPRHPGKAGPGAAPLFLTARSAADLAPVLAAYGQTIGPKSDADDPFGPYAHQLRVYLIDCGARIRNIYSLGFLDPRLVIGDIRTLLLEENRDENR